MKPIALAVLLALTISFGSSADKPKVSRDQIAKMELAIDARLKGLASKDDPVEVVGLTQGMYINGFGAVFAGEVNLAPTAGISPFHPSITKEEMVRIHEKKMQRLVKLKDAMQEILLSSAGSLDPIPGDERIAVGITLFNWQGENTTGLPAQVVMYAPKSVLVKVKSGAADRASLASALTVQEF
jgi:hypothetical protein